MRWRREAELRCALVGRRVHARGLELAPSRVHRLRRAGAPLGLSAHRVGERTQPTDLLILTLRHRREALLVPRSGLTILRVGTAVLHDPVTVEVQDARDRGVEQADVVAHDEQRARIGREELHEPRLRVDVEMVRGFVEHQQVGPAEEDARELETTTLPARQGPDRQRQAILREAEPGRDRPHLRFGSVPARRAVLVLEPGEPRDVALRRIFLERESRLLQPHGQIDEVARLEQVDQRDRVVAPSVLSGILPQVADGPASHDRTPGRRTFARQHPQHAGLPGTVAPDDPHLLAGSHGEAQVAHHGRATRLDLELEHLERDHRSCRRPRRRVRAERGDP